LQASWRVDSSHKSANDIAADLEQRINAELSAQEKTR
jgi:hypothetical protein